MNKNFVNVINVIDVANAILSINKHLIKPHIQADANAFINDLKISLDIFNHPFGNKKSKYHSPVLQFDKNLEDLIKATENAYNILTNEGKSLIQQHIKQLNNQKVSAVKNS
jgi:hypothetical protein